MKLLLILSFTFCFSAFGFIEFVPKSVSVWGEELKSTEVKLISEEYRPGHFSLYFLFPFSLDQVSSFKLVKGPGRFENITDLSDIGRHWVQWKLTRVDENKLRFDFKGTKSTVARFRARILSQKTLYPYFFNRIKLGQLVNVPKINIEKFSWLRDKVDLKCEMLTSKRANCSSSPRLAYVKVNECSQLVPKSVMVKVKEELLSLFPLNMYALTKSICLDRNPEQDIHTIATLNIIQSVVGGNDLVELMSYLEKDYAISF